MINSTNVDSSVGNQVVNKAEATKGIVNQQSVEPKKENTSVVTTDEVESTQELNVVNAVDETKETKETEENVDTLEQAFKTVSDFINVYNRNVTFSKDDESDTTVIKVFDRDTQELIKQFPSEELVELANKISEVSKDIDIQSGLFFDERI